MLGNVLTQLQAPKMLRRKHVLLVPSGHSPQSLRPHTVQATPQSSQSLEGVLRAIAAALGDSSRDPWQERGKKGGKRKAFPQEEEEMLRTVSRAGAQHPLGSTHIGSGQHAG